MKSDGASANVVGKVGYIFDTLRAGLAEPPAEEIAAEQKYIPTMIMRPPTDEEIPDFPSVQSTTEEEESLAVRARRRRGSSMVSDGIDIAPKGIGAGIIERGSSVSFVETSNYSMSVESTEIEPRPVAPPIEENIVVTSTFMEPISASPGNEFFKASPPPDEVSDMSAPEPTKSRQTKPPGGKKAAQSGSKPSVKSTSSKGDVYVQLSFAGFRI